MKHTSILILHNIRSVHNVGAIFRTADGVGVQKIYVTGYTPTPVDRFGRERKDFIKASLGAEKFVAWEQVEDVHALIQKLRSEHIKIIAIEQSKKSVDYRTVKPTAHIACILGNEVEGISQEILDSVDVVAEIPMFGKKESLNVASACAIALYGILHH